MPFEHEYPFDESLPIGDVLAGDFSGTALLVDDAGGFYVRSITLDGVRKQIERRGLYLLPMTDTSPAKVTIDADTADPFHRWLYFKLAERIHDSRHAEESFFDARREAVEPA